MQKNTQETIVAPITATGGAIAVVRMSGPRSIEICDAMFNGQTSLVDAKGYTAHFGQIVDGEDGGSVVDDVVVTVFRSPHSFTGEASVEISCHGSRYIVTQLIAMAQHHGARIATPGEFSQRAFLAGKLDLSQAEAIADLIAADSRAELALAATQMRGGYSARLAELRANLLTLTSLLELELDFGEEEVEFADRTRLRDMMEQLTTQIDTLRRSFDLGHAIKSGVSVAIVGAPNAGKSTLLNRLVGEERALVSDVAGTTRDTVDELIDIDGVRFRFIDTAGLHDSHDMLERLGMERSREALRKAQIVLQVADAAESLPEQISVRDDQTHIWVVNKVDLSDHKSDLPDALRLSARTGHGIDKLLSHLRGLYDTRQLYDGEPIVSNSRHAEALARAAEALTRARTALHDGLSAELLSEEIREVIHHLGTITGEVTNDEVLQTIFAKFCIGK